MSTPSLRQLGHGLRYAHSGEPPKNGNRLLDYTGVERFGLRGRGGVEWFTTQDLPVSANINRAAVSDRGDIVMRLGTSDIVVLRDPAVDRPNHMEFRHKWQSDPKEEKGFDALRDEGWAWFELAGANSRDILAKFCGIDLHEKAFGSLEIAQTRLAHMNAVLLRSDRGANPVFDIFFDITAADYFIDVARDAGSEFDLGIYGKCDFTDANWRRLA